MLFDELPIALPWYDNIQKQDRFKENVAHDGTKSQLAPFDGLLPFQFRKSAASELPISWGVFCVVENDDLLATIATVNLSPFIRDLHYGSFGGFDYFWFNDDDNATINPLLSASSFQGLQAGTYYMKMVFSDKSYYSETFRVPEERFSTFDSSTCNYPVLTWVNSRGDIAPIKYSGVASGFYNKMYLNSFIHASEPRIELYDAIKDGFNETFYPVQKAVIQYNVSVLVPDYAKIALTIMQMHDSVTLLTERGIRVGDLKNFEVKSILESDGAYSTMEIQFEQQTIITNMLCASNIPADGLISIVGPHLIVHVILIYPGTGALVSYKIPTMPPATYGELWYNNGGVPTLVIPYVSRGDLIVGYEQDVLAYDSHNTYFVKIMQFAGQVGVSDMVYAT